MKEMKEMKEEMKEEIECKDCTPKDELKEGEGVECMMYGPCSKCGHHGVVASGLRPVGDRHRFPVDYNICHGCSFMTEVGNNITKHYRMYDVGILWGFQAEIAGSHRFEKEFEESALKHARSIFDCGCDRPFPIYQQKDDTTGEETWGKLDETGVAPPGLSIFCAHCNADKGEE